MVEFLEEFLEITTPEDFSVLQKKLEDVPLDIVTKYGIGKVKLNKPKEVKKNKLAKFKPLIYRQKLLLSYYLKMIYMSMQICSKKWWNALKN